MKYGLGFLLLLSTWVQAEPAKLAHDISSVKASVLELNFLLNQLEDELMSPITTQIAFYFSLRGSEAFEPRAIELRAGDLPSVHHIYTQRQIDTLRMGAIQPLASMHIGPGLHTVKARISGVDRRGNPVHLDIEKTVEKTAAPLLLEMLVNVQAGKPDAQMRVW